MMFQLCRPGYDFEQLLSDPSEAYARTEALEQEEAAARQGVFRRLNRLEIAKAKGVAAVKPSHRSGRESDFQALSEIRAALSELTATLDWLFRPWPPWMKSRATSWCQRRET